MSLNEQSLSCSKANDEQHMTVDEYARHAAHYDTVVGPFLRPIHSAMVAQLVNRRCETLVDLCCGTGLLAGMAAKSGIDTIGIDISSAMLAVGRDNYPAVKFIAADATSLQFPDDQFDAASISFALHEKPDEMSQSILREARRVVRPGGIILVADYRHPVNRTSLLSGWGIALVERLAGMEHYTNFRHFMATGGSTSFLTRAGSAGIPSMTFFHGWAGLYVNEV